MAQWQKVQYLPGDSINLIYKSEGFPIIIRHVFANWIEENDWNELDENDESYGVMAKGMLDTLIQMMQEKIPQLNNPNDFVLRMQLGNLVDQFRKLYTREPGNLLRAIKNCLALERQLILEAEQANVMCKRDGSSDTLHTTAQLILHKIAYIEKLNQDMEHEVKVLQQNQESFIIQHQRSVGIDTELKVCSMESRQSLCQQKAALEEKLRNMGCGIIQMRINLIQKFEQNLQFITELMTKVVDEELKRWKYKQRLASSGSMRDNNLMSVQHWCESLAEIIWHNRQQIKQLDRLLSQLPINTDPVRDSRVRELETSIIRHLSCLIKNTFIVESQPPQVLKKDARFSASVRLLVGSKLNVHMNPPQVKVSIINDMQARTIMSGETLGPMDTSGEILNNTGPMEYDHTMGHLGMTFRNMQLKKIKRAERKGCESVTEEKFCLLFHSEFNLGSGELVFQVRTLSLPVVVIVHGNQECSAQATIMWDNMFAEESRNLFDVPESVPWFKLAELLSMKFKVATDLGLDADNKSYLHSKIFGSGISEEGSIVSWSQFNKEQLSMRTFTFWEWFYGVLKLTKDHLLGPWRDGSIIGFISKERAQEYLMLHQNGTFLLRFSDSLIGGVTISWVGYDRTGKRAVFNLQPYTVKNLPVRSLADRIKDLNSLTHLYPDVPKDNAFSLYYSSATEQPKGTYIVTELVDTIPNPPAQNISPVSEYDSRPSSVHSLYEWTPATNPGAFPNHNVIQMDVTDPQSDIETLVAMNDYNPDDISLINVNDILSN